MGVPVQQVSNFELLVDLVSVFVFLFLTRLLKKSLKSIGKTKPAIMPEYRRMCQYNICVHLLFLFALQSKTLCTY